MLKGDDDLREVHAKARRANQEVGALAEQLSLTGVCLLSPAFTLVYVEGAARFVRKYKHLLLTRIAWTGAARARRRRSPRRASRTPGTTSCGMASCASARSERSSPRRATRTTSRRRRSGRSCTATGTWRRTTSRRRTSRSSRGCDDA
jgi:hypothetical protein